MPLIPIRFFTRSVVLAAVAGALALAAVGVLAADREPTPADAAPGPAIAADDPVVAHATDMIERGRTVFRYDRMGSHTFFSRALKLHTALNGLAPSDALAVGLKVDSDALPPAVIDALLAGEVDLEDPAVTRFLILSDAVVGVVGEEAPGGGLWEVGITCALCHSTVDDSVAPGVGRRLDGWANRDLDVGAIVALAPRLQPFADLLGVSVPTVRTVLRSWGPGRFNVDRG
jgi:hypothetical protein